MLKQPTQLRGALLAGVVAIAWLILAWRSPTLTYHFAPFIGALVWPLSMRTLGRREAADAWRAAGGALAMMLAVSLILVLANKMEGPNFLHVGPAWPEAVLFALWGAVLGARVASRERAGLLGGLVEVS